MTHSNLRVEVQGPFILVAMRGTCLRAKFRKQEAPWLAMDEYEENFRRSNHLQGVPNPSLGGCQRKGSRPRVGQK